MTEITIRIQVDGNEVRVDADEPKAGFILPAGINRTTFDLLTAREHEILEYLVAGFQNQEIARALIISEKTVRTHVSNISRTIGYSSSRRMIALALLCGAVEPERVLAIWRDEGNPNLTEDIYAGTS